MHLVHRLLLIIAIGWALPAHGQTTTPSFEADALGQTAAAIRQADYRGDRDLLARLADSIDVERGAAELKAYRAYWRGFALWRRAQNGFAATPPPNDLLADLVAASRCFRIASSAAPEFEDASSALLGALYGELFLRGRGAPRELIDEAVATITKLRAANSENPRTLWVLGTGEAYSPPPVGGDLTKAASTFRRGLAAAHRQDLEEHPAPWVPSWGSAELMMSLAYLHTREGAVDARLARAYATAALALEPEWRFVQTTLLSSIDALEATESARVANARAAIEELHRRDREASRAMDQDTLVELWTDDVVSVPAEGPATRGRAANAQRLAALAAGLRQAQVESYELHFEEVSVHGDWAYEWGTYSGVLRGTAAGAPSRLTGRLMRILAREPDGAWRVARTLYTSPVAGADAAAFTLQEGAVTVTKRLGESRALEFSVEIPAPVADVWNAMTTSEGLVTWITPEARVDLRPGGEWLAIYPGAAPGGGTITRVDPRVALGLRTLAPEAFPEVRRRGTDALFTFEAKGDSTTVVHLRQTGWQQGAEWDAAFAYLARGNAMLLEMLRQRFVHGPRDWSPADSVGGN